MKKFVKMVGNTQALYQDLSTGIAWIDDKATGERISVHPFTRANQSRSRWGADCRVRVGGSCRFNIDEFQCDTPMQEIVKQACQCRACDERRTKERMGEL